jgi:hypothetical protein
MLQHPIIPIGASCQNMNPGFTFPYDDAAIADAFYAGRLESCLFDQVLIARSKRTEGGKGTRAWQQLLQPPRL